MILTLIVWLLGASSSMAQQPKSTPRTDRLLDRIFNGQKVPENFETLIKHLTQRLENETGAEIVVTREGIDGRSLDEDHDSVESPRELVAFGIENRSGTATPVLFLGYAPMKARLELIAFEPQRGWDFALAEPFHPSKKGSDIVVGPSSNKLCSSCHQAEAPIFSRFPWDETRGSNRNGVFSDAAKAGLKSQDASIVELRNFSSQNSLLLTESPTLFKNIFLRQPFGFDNLVRNANRAAQESRMCRTLCEKSDSSCRTRLFALVMSNAVSLIGADSPRRNEFSTFEGWIKGHVRSRWPKDLFTYPSSVLLDRQLEKGSDGFTMFIQGANSNDPQRVIEEAFSEDSATSPLISNFNHLPRQVLPQKIPGYRRQLGDSNGKTFDHPGNPQTQRPLINPISLVNPFEAASTGKRVLIPAISKSGVIGGRSFTEAINASPTSSYACFGLTDSNVLIIKDHFRSLDFDAISNRGLQYLDQNKELQKAFKEGLTGPSLVRVFDNNSGSTEACITCSLESFGDFFAKPNKVLRQISDKILEHVNNSRERASELAQKHCSDCHGPESAIPLPLDDGKKMANYKSKGGKTPAERISQQEMPPPAYRSIQKARDPRYEKELNELSKYLEAAAQDRK